MQLFNRGTPLMQRITMIAESGDYPGKAEVMTACKAKGLGKALDLIVSSCPDYFLRRLPDGRFPVQEETVIYLHGIVRNNVGQGIAKQVLLALDGDKYLCWGITAYMTKALANLSDQPYFVGGQDSLETLAQAYSATALQTAARAIGEAVGSKALQVVQPNGATATMDQLYAGVKALAEPYAVALITAANDTPRLKPTVSLLARAAFEPRGYDAGTSVYFASQRIPELALSELEAAARPNAV